MKRSPLSIVMRLIGLVRPLIGWMVIAVLMGLAGHLCASFITIFGAWAVLDAAGVSAFLTVGTIFALILVFALLRGILRYAEQACNHYIAFKLLAIIRDHVFKALRRLCPAKLEGRDKGNLISVITSDIELLEVFYAHTISPVLIALLYSIVMVAFIGSFNPVFGVIAAVSYLFIGVVTPLFIARLGGDDADRYRDQSGKLSSFVLDSLRGLAEILQYNAGSKRLASMEEESEKLSHEEEKMKKNTGRNMALTGSVILLSDLAMLIAAVLLYQNGTVGFEALVLAPVALMSSFGPCVALANLGSQLQNTFAAGSRVLDILDETPVVEEISGCEPVAYECAETKDLSFSYDDESILENVNIELRPDEIVGITGRSGSGKSTLLKLLMRFWEAEDGEVRISNREISTINTSDLRSMQGYVTQSTHLFHDTIRNNLKIAKLDATDEQIEQACRKASVHDFIMSLPNGYDTQVGELGDTLSGGERQRLGLARAFLHDAPLMLLDEPTSNLDSLNEAVILRSLDEQRKDKTIVLVSHRKSTMRIVDRSYSVENGRLS